VNQKNLVSKPVKNAVIHDTYHSTIAESYLVSSRIMALNSVTL